MIENIKKRLRSNTYRVALVGAILTAIELNSGVLLGNIPEQYHAFALAIWPIAMLTMREVTNTAVSDK
jgi:hypothetical protein